MSARRTYWPLVFYRVLTFPVAMSLMWAGRLLFVGGVFLAWGPRSTREAWNDTR